MAGCMDRETRAALDDVRDRKTKFMTERDALVLAAVKRCGPARVADLRTPARMSRYTHIRTALERLESAGKVRRVQQSARVVLWEVA